MATSAGTNVYFEDLRVGQEIPRLLKHPTPQQLVRWAAGSGDFNPAHYDIFYAKAQGLPGVIVHGALKHAFLEQMLWDWVTPSGGRIKRCAVSYRALDFPGDEMTCRGVITRLYQEGGENLVDLDVWTENPSGQKTTPGSATVSLPSRP